MPVGYSIYVEKDSFIHKKMDPRSKMAVLATICIVALCFNNPLFLAVPVIFILLVSAIAKLGFKRLVPSFLASSWFILLSLLIWPFYIEQGTPLFTIFNQVITDHGIYFAIAMGLRVSVMVIAASVWMMVTSPQYLTLGLLHLGMPYKAGIAMSTSIRFIPLINAERATILEAQRARGLDYQNAKFIKKATQSVPIIGPLFLRSIELAQSLAVAMDARGFGIGEGRTNLYHIELSTLDRIINWSCLIIAVGSVFLRIFGFGVLVPGYL
jgi:energy-coupling factor transport system permease protein